MFLGIYYKGIEMSTRYLGKCFIYFVTIFFWMITSGAMGQEQDDSLIFTIKLSDDTNSIYGCRWDDKVRLNLAGPVLMEKGSLLFFSQFGYLLYGQDGTLIDSHFLFKMNKGNSSPYQLAYPLDSTTILYYREKPGEPPQVFQKRLFKDDLRGVSVEKYQVYSEINRSMLFNIASNSITDEMSTKSFLFPQLIGYTSLIGGIKWWTTDKMYSFSSPMVVEQEEKYLSFFPGMKADQPCDVKRHLIEPLGVFQTDGRWFYYGLYSSMGNTANEYYQTLILCDQAGNILSSDRLLKQEITDAVLTHVKNDDNNTNFTVRRAGRHVFVPAIDRRGILFYGIINFEWKKLDVYKREHRHYVPVGIKADIESKFAEESNIAFSPIKLECNPLALRGVRPEVILTNGKEVSFLDNDQTTRQGFYAMVHRYTDENLHTKLNRIQSSLPEKIQKMQDSIAKQSTSWCPYTIGLNKDPKGEIAKIFYGFGDVIMCARVVAVTSAKEVFVRVDLDTWAEMIVFTTEGKYITRFIFNRQPYEQRKDLMVVTDKREIFERDFESDRNGKSYCRWELR
jgi:hypothetical protein